MEDVGTVNIMIVLSKISSVPLQIATSITNVTVIGMYVDMNKNNMHLLLGKINPLCCKFF